MVRRPAPSHSRIRSHRSTVAPAFVAIVLILLRAIYGLFELEPVRLAGVLLLV
jgi:hypothetical protein